MATRSEKSAEAVVAAGMGRRAKRGEVFEAMSMQRARRQMPAQAERAGVARGEAVRDPVSDEARCPRHDTKSTGSALLRAALTRENLQRAFKRVKANKGAAGVDGLDITQTARQLVTVWPAIREQLLSGTYRPSPVRRVGLSAPLFPQGDFLRGALEPTYSNHRRSVQGRKAGTDNTETVSWASSAPLRLS